MPRKDIMAQVLETLIKADGRTDVEIAADLDISSQRLGNYKAGKRFPDAEFVSRWKKVFKQDLMELYNERESNVSHETENLTSGDKTSDNNGKSMNYNLEMKDFLGDERYRLVPTVILDQYEILSKGEIKNREKVLEQFLNLAREISATKDVVIAAKNQLIAELEEEIKELRSLKTVTSAQAAK